MVGDKHEICKGLHFANVKAYIEVDSALISGRRRDMPLFGAISCSDAAVACTGILIPAGCAVCFLHADCRATDRHYPCDLNNTAS